MYVACLEAVVLFLLFYFTQSMQHTRNDCTKINDNDIFQLYTQHFSRTSTHTEVVGFYLKCYNFQKKDFFSEVELQSQSELLMVFLVFEKQKTEKEKKMTKY